MADALPIPERMDADAFLRWAERQPGRYELEDGRVVAQANEQSAHALLKFQVHRQLFEAVARAGAPCFVYPDGMNVRVDEATIYCPDGRVRCGPRLPDDALEVGDSAIVVEVVSSSSEVRDTVYKLDGYFRIPSLLHYLILRTEAPTLIHHARGEGNAILTRIVTRQAVRLDPPGIVLDDWWPGE